MKEETTADLTAIPFLRNRGVGKLQKLEEHSVVTFLLNLGQIVFMPVFVDNNGGRYTPFNLPAQGALVSRTESNACQCFSVYHL